MFVSVLFYWVLAIATGLCTKYSVSSKRKESRLFYKFFAIMIPSFFAGIRLSAGTDTLLIYKPIFDRIYYGYGSTLKSMDTVEVGYLLINKFVALIGPYFQLVLFISAVITTYFVYKTIIYYKEHVNVGICMWSYMMLFYLITYNAIRQFIAIAIFMYAVRYLNSKHYFKCFILIFISALFHKISIIYFLVLMFSGILEKNDKKYIRWLGYLLLFLIILNFSTLQSMLSKIDSISYYVASYLRTTDATGISIGFFVRTIPLLLPMIFLPKNVRSDRRFKFIYSMVVLGSILRLFAYVTNTYAERIAYNFLIFQIIIVGYYFKNIRKYRKSIKFFIIAFIIFISFYDYYLLGIGQVIPYDTILIN